MRIKEICNYVSRGTTPEYVDDSPFKVMNQATFSKGWLDESNIRFTSKPVSDAQITKGDLLMASTGGGVLGKVFYFDKDDTSFYADSHVSILRNSKGKHLMKFLYYYFLIRYEEINATMVKGSTNQTELQRNYLLAYEINMPSLSNQQKIVNYLDEKTSAIDIQVELLEKKKDAYTRLKKAIINRAVTRGLDENVKLKDSGVEWIGLIPEHWDVKRIKDFSELRSGDNLTSIDISEEGEFPVYGGNGIRGYYHSYSNDGSYVLIGRQGALCGNIHIVNGKFWATDHAVVCYPKAKFDVRWFGELLRAMDLGQYSFAAAQPGLAVERIKNLKIIVPPLTEQHTIASYLDEKSAKIDAAIENIGKQIDASKRLKRALINEVITGKRNIE